MKKAKLDQQVEANERTILEGGSLSSKQHNELVDKWIRLFSADEKLNRDFERPSQIKVKNTPLESELFTYLSRVVPSLLKETNNGGVLRYMTDEDKLNAFVCEPLEHFICDKNDALSTLKEFSNPAKFCGKVFELGDPTYTCKDCSSDPTCVFCHDCFFNSAHQNHKYKLHASQGTGGYCDCGDEEAWSSHPACEKHQDGMEVDENADPMQTLPEEIKRRATFIIAFLVQYCVDLICWENDHALPYPLAISQDEDPKYIVMLFNDESHTYDEVTETLKAAVPNCTSKQALHFATIVDKMGRSAIVTGDREFCKDVAEKCDMLTSSNGNKDPLKCNFMHSDVVAHQVVAQSLMSWLVTLLQASDGIRRILTILATERLDGRPNAILDQVISVDVKLWKCARSHVHQLFMNGILMDMYGRQQFAIVFIKNYQQIMSDFIKDDHDHSVSVAALSVQIFTVPTIADMLLEEHSALLKCFTAFWNGVKPVLSAHGSLDFQYNPHVVDIKRVDFILRDIGYLLRHKPKWTEKLKVQFLLAFNRILELLCAMQGMDACTRKVKSHVAYEPHWENGINLQIVFVPIIEMLLTWAYSDIEVYKAVMFMCVTALKEMYSKLRFTTYNESPVSDYDVTKSLVSVHAPLSRLVAGLVPGMINFPTLNTSELLQVDKSLSNEERQKCEVVLMEAPLRTLVLMAQVYSQMWKRNGYSLVHQVYYYHNVRFGTETYDRDILMLQTMGGVMEPNHFIDNIIYKHRLNGFFSEMTSTNDEEDENDGKSALVAHEFFHLLYLLLGERYVVNVSEVTIIEILRREVIHRLALGPATRSSLVKNLPTKDIDDEEDTSFEVHLDSVLEEVATYKSPSIDGKGTYELKKELMTGVNQFFIHYARNERAKLVEQKKKLIKQYPVVKEFGLNDLPAWTPTFEKILRLFECDRMEFLLRCVLKYQEKFASEETVELVMLIIGIGLLEVKRNNLPNFLAILTKPIEEGKNIKNLLEEMSKSTKHYSGILKWLKQLLDQAMPEEGTKEINLHQHDQTKEDEMNRKKQLALERRKKMMAQMNNMQKAFMKTHKGFFADDVEMTDGGDVTDSKPNHFPVALGTHCTTSSSETSSYSSTVQCILCQEQENIENDTNLFVMTCFQQKSSVFPEHSNASVGGVVTPQLTDLTMTHVSSCGHILHGECWNKFYQIVKEKLMPTLIPRQRSCIDITQSEYLCPLCNSLCNTVLPLLPKIESEKSEDVQEMGLNEFLSYLERFAAELSSVAPKKGEKEERRHKSHSRLFSFGIRFLQRFGSRDDESAQNVMEMFAKKLEQFNLLDERSECIPLTWMSFSFTLQSLECVYRELNTNMFSEISDRQMMFLYSFVQYLSSSSLVGVYEPIQKYGTEIFNFFCGESSTFSLPTTDVFGLMVSLRFLVSAVGNIFQEKIPNFLKIPQYLLNDVVFKICFIAYYVKVLMIAPTGVCEDSPEEQKETEKTEESEEKEESEDYLIESWRFIHSLLANGMEADTTPPRNMKKYVVTSMLPFLRCSALFFHYLTRCNLPEELMSKSLDESNEMEFLLKYLNLPTNLRELLSVDILKNDPLVARMIERWCRHDAPNTSVDRCYLTSRRLIDLPDQYSTLIKRASGFKCPMVGDPSRSPSVCLICGEMVCSQCYCCATETKSYLRLGASAGHIDRCGKGLGVFLKIRDCEVYFLYNQKKGVFMAAPYLDKYGEPDRQLRRGNPLFLDKDRYERLQNYWLQHKVPSMIAQAMENNRNLLAYEWTMM